MARKSTTAGFRPIRRRRVTFLWTWQQEMGHKKQPVAEAAKGKTAEFRKFDEFCSGQNVVKKHMSGTGQNDMSHSSPTVIMFTVP